MGRSVVWRTHRGRFHIERQETKKGNEIYIFIKKKIHITLPVHSHKAHALISSVTNVNVEVGGAVENKKIATWNVKRPRKQMKYIY